MSALPDASKQVLKHLFGPPPPKGGGSQPVAKHDQARITTFFTRTPVIQGLGFRVCKGWQGPHKCMQRRLVDPLSPWSQLNTAAQHPRHALALMQASTSSESIAGCRIDERPPRLPTYTSSHSVRTNPSASSVPRSSYRTTSAIWRSSTALSCADGEGVGRAHP
eukprot:365684-Chlamydomonas_euryale.AAC.1